MIHGVLIAESLRPGERLDGIGLVVRAIRRVVPRDKTPAQPRTWTLIEFEAGDNAADPLAEALAGVLDQPSWYVDFRSDRETFVVFPGRIFRYPRGDTTTRAAAKAYARTLDIPTHNSTGRYSRRWYPAARSAWMSAMENCTVRSPRRW